MLKNHFSGKVWWPSEEKQTKKFVQTREIILSDESFKRGNFLI